MHLSLLREYLDLEFQDLHTTLSFSYDLERIIDDFVLLALFIGNDFLPHLPNLHINEGALTLMFSIYKRVLPTIGGYLHEGGTLDLERLEIIFKELAEGFEKEVYENEMSERKWLEGKKTQGWTEKQLEEKLKMGNGRRKGAKGQVGKYERRVDSVVSWIFEYSLDLCGIRIVLIYTLGMPDNLIKC